MFIIYIEYKISLSRRDNETITDTGKHTGILYNGIVRCNIHPKGLPLSIWINDFIAPIPHFGEVTPSRYQHLKVRHNS